MAAYVFSLLQIARLVEIADHLDAIVVKCDLLDRHRLVALEGNRCRFRRAETECPRHREHAAEQTEHLAFHGLLHFDLFLSLAGFLKSF